MVDCYRPSDLSELLDIRAETGAIPFAGGTDLMVRLRRAPGVLPVFDKPVVFIDRCEELRRIEVHEARMRVGAGVTMAELLSHPSVHPAMKKILSEIAAPALRNVATLGGNICNASPAADSLPFLYAFDAEVEVKSSGSSRIVPIDRFITGPGAIDLRDDEILSAVTIPDWKPSVWYFKKVGTRKANALTKVSFAGFAEVNEGVVERIALTLGAVAATAVRLEDVENECTGASPKEVRDGVSALSETCGLAISPIDDQRSTADYRRRAGINLLRHFLTSELERGEE